MSSSVITLAATYQSTRVQNCRTPAEDTGAFVRRSVGRFWHKKGLSPRLSAILKTLKRARRHRRHWICSYMARSRPWRGSPPMMFSGVVAVYAAGGCVDCFSSNLFQGFCDGSFAAVDISIPGNGGAYLLRPHTFRAGLTPRIRRGSSVFSNHTFSDRPESGAHQRFLRGRLGCCMSGVDRHGRTIAKIPRTKKRTAEQRA